METISYSRIEDMINQEFDSSNIYSQHDISFMFDTDKSSYKEQLKSKPIQAKLKNRSKRAFGVAK